MRTGYIIVNKKRINYIDDDKTIIFADGKVIGPKTSLMDVAASYKQATIPVVKPVLTDYKFNWPTSKIKIMATRVTSGADGSFLDFPNNGTIKRNATGNTVFTIVSDKRIQLQNDVILPVGTNTINFTDFPSGSPVKSFLDPVVQLVQSVISFGASTASSNIINWTSVLKATNYVVRRSLSSDMSGATQIYSGPLFTFTDNGLIADTTYFYTVTASAFGYTSSVSAIQAKATSASQIPDFNPPAGTYRSIQLVSNQNMDVGDITNEKVRFVPGNYTNIYLQFGDLNDAIIDMTGVTIGNCLIELGPGNNNKIYGLGVRDQNNAPLRLDFGLNNTQLITFNFLNCYNGPISFQGQKDYLGTDATLNKGFKLLNSIFEDSDGVSMDGHLDETKDDGLFKDFEIAYNTFKNMPSAGKVLSAQNAWNYNIHHNIIDNINAENDNHNGVFEVNGNGLFHHNKFTHYQGNSIRMWLFSRGNTPAMCEIFENICYDTRKYSGFELQEFARFLRPGKTTYANAKVYNNTVGRMNTTIPYVFEGQILDLYNISGSLEFYNNLGFELQKQSGPITDMINYNGNSTPDVVPVNNVYKATAAEAVENLTTFKSKVPGVGATV